MSQESPEPSPSVVRGQANPRFDEPHDTDAASTAEAETLGHGLDPTLDGAGPTDPHPCPPASDPHSTIVPDDAPESGSSAVDPTATAADPHATTAGISPIGSSPAMVRGGTPSSADPAPTLDEPFGHYVLHRELARGGMGVVYRARDTRLNRWVAIKMILLGAGASDQLIKRFYGEAQAAGGLDHPNIVPIYDVGQIDDQHYFAMALVDGDSLGDWLRNHEPNRREIAEVMHQIAGAVQYAHEHGIVHRDLKPGNVLVDRGGTPRVTDFGLAKTLSDRDNEITSSGQILGTPSYMPPEQARGDLDQIGPTSDVYALGAVLYFLLTGVPPFRDPRVTETLRQVMSEPPKSPRAINASVDRDLETICLKCLEKFPEQRYATAADVADELQRYLDREPILARPIGPARRVGRWCKRHPSKTISVLAIALLLPLAFGLTSAIRASNRASRIGIFNDSIDVRLQSLQIDEASLNELGSELNSLRRLAPDEAAKADRRIRGTLSRIIESNLAAPRLTVEDLDRVSGLLDASENYPGYSADDYRDRLQALRREWNEVVRVESPIDSVPPLLNGAVTLSPIGLHNREPNLLVLDPTLDELRSRVPLWESPLIPTQHACVQNTRVSVQLSDSWRSAHDLGLLINSENNRGYEFWLRVVEINDLAGYTLRFETAAQGGSGIVAEIRRDDGILIAQAIQLDQLPDGPLTLHAERDGSRLTMRIDDAVSLSVQDAFPLPHDQGRVVVAAPSVVAITGMTIEEKALAPSTPLEQADRLLAQRRYGEAATQFARLSQQLSETEFAVECDVKLAWCYRHVQRVVESERLLEQRSLAEGNRWPAIATALLWQSLLDRDENVEAEKVAGFALSRFPADVWTSVPAETRHAILDRYFRDARYLGDRLRFDPGRTASLQRLIELDRRLSPGRRANSELLRRLCTAYRRSQRWQDALDLLDELRTSATLDNEWAYIIAQTSRCYRRSERLGEAHRQVNELRRRQFGPESERTALLELANISAAMDRFDEAGLYARAARPDTPDAWYNQAARTRFIEAVCAERLGDLTEAQLHYHACAQNLSGYLNQNVDLTHYDLLCCVAASARSGTLDIESVRKTIAIGKKSSDPTIGVLLSLFNEDTIRRGLEIAFGREEALPELTKLAFDQYSIDERVHQIGRQVGSGVVAASSRILFPSHARWDLFRSQLDGFFQGFITEQSIPASAIMQMGLAWKGSTGLLGWQGLRSSLPPSMQKTVGLTLAHRYIGRGEPDKALEVLDSVSSEADPADRKTVLEQLRRGIAENIGFIKIANPDDFDGEIRLRSVESDEDVLKVRVAASDLVIEATAGQYRVELGNETWVADPEEIDVLPGFEFRLRLRQLSPPRQAWTYGAVPHPPVDEAPFQVYRSRPNSYPFQLIFSPDNSLVAGIYNDHTVWLFETDTANLRAVFPPQNTPTAAIAFSPDSKLLAIASRFGGAQVHAVADGRLAAHINPPQHTMERIAFAGNQRLCFVDNRATLYLAELNDLNVGFEMPDAKMVFQGVDGEFTNQRFLGRLSGILFRGSDSRTLSVIDVDSGERIFDRRFDSPIYSLAVDASNRFVCVVTDAQVQILDDGGSIVADLNLASPQDASCVRSETPNQWVWFDGLGTQRTLDFDPEARTLTAGDQRTTRMTGPGIVGSAFAHGRPHVPLGWMHAGDWHDLRSADRVYFAADWHPTAGMVACAYGGQWAKIDPENHSVEPWGEQTFDGTSLCFDPAGQRLAAVDLRNLRRWLVFDADGKLQSEFESSLPINELHWMDDGSQLVAVSGKLHQTGRVVMGLDPATGEVLWQKRYELLNSISIVRSSPTDPWLATSLNDPSGVLAVHDRSTVDLLGPSGEIIQTKTFPRADYRELDIVDRKSGDWFCLGWGCPHGFTSGKLMEVESRFHGPSKIVQGPGQAIFSHFDSGDWFRHHADASETPYEKHFWMAAPLWRCGYDASHMALLYSGGGIHFVDLRRPAVLKTLQTDRQDHHWLDATGKSLQPNANSPALLRQRIDIATGARTIQPWNGTAE